MATEKNARQISEERAAAQGEVFNSFKDAGVGAGVCHCHIRVLLDGLFHAVLVGLLVFNLHGFHVVLQLLLHMVTETVRHTGSVLLKRFVQRDVSGSQAGVPLGHNVMGAKHAAERCNAQANCRGIDLGQRHAGMDVGSRDIIFERCSIDFC